MNLTLAKRIAGISPQENVSSREAVDKAVRTCAKLAAPHHPDRNPNNKRAAKRFFEIMAARDFFKAKMPHGCLVCGETISRGATHCRIHQRTTALPPADGSQPVLQSKGNGNARVSVVGDPHALLGYYTAPVQKVVSKWREEIREPMLQRYFESVASAVVFRDSSMQLPFVAPQHWQAVFELGRAICNVLANIRTPHGWLLKLSGIHVATNGRFPSTAEISQQIIDAGGKSFKSGNIAQALKGMKLTTPREISAEFRKSVMKKSG